MTPTLDPPIAPSRRRRWNRDECKFLENAGLLKGRYELLDGEIILNMGQNSPHAITVMRVILYLARLFNGDCIRTQTTMEVRADDRVLNRPEPDVVVLREIIYTGAPAGEDVLLAVEVSDTTQTEDYGHKVGLYARAGVAEYWVLDLARRVLVVFRSPQRGEWLVRDEYAEDAQVAPLTAPHAPVAVSDLLPPLEIVSDLPAPLTP